MKTPTNITEVLENFDDLFYPESGHIRDVERHENRKQFFRQQFEALLETVPLEEFKVYDDESDNCRRIIGETSYWLNKIKK